MTQHGDSGQAFLVSYINQALPQYTPERAEAYGQVQAMDAPTLSENSRGQG
jgi:hypothetical protein